MGVQDTYSERRLERALQHVSAHWLPIQPEVLSRIRNGLENGAYDLDVGFLISDLKQDFGLFAYCIKELLPIALKNNVALPTAYNPIALLKWAGTAKLRMVLGAERQPPETHSIDNYEPLLVDRLAETSISSTTAATLSKAQNLDADTAFCHGVIRQIGLNLIAWNYPTVYARVLRSLTASSSLDEALAHELGFSPSLLGLRLLKPQVEHAHPQSQRIASDWKMYDTLCSVGEALARANNPEVYPTAEKDWSLAHKFIESSIGTDGVQLIRKRALENTASYHACLPNLFGKLTSFDPETKIKSHRKGFRAASNPYLRFCPPGLQAALQNIYAEMPTGVVNKLALERLIKQIIPQAGFSGGCVYVVDPTAMHLAPRVSFGKVALRTLRAIPLQPEAGRAIGPLISEVISTHMRSSRDLALAALSCDQPLVERNEREDALSVGAICGALGKRRKIGVLYLELPDEQLNSTDPIALKMFKALRHTLCDALLVDG